MNEKERREEGRKIAQSLGVELPKTKQQPPKRREVRQPYPDMGMTSIRPDYTPIIRAGVASIVLLSALVFGINAALQSKNADSPADTPTHAPTATLDRIQIRSEQAYRQLLQGRNNPDGSLYRSFDVGSEDPTVRIGPSTHAPAIGKLEADSHIEVESTTDFGDDPGTLTEEGYDKPWQAMECDDIRPFLINRVTSAYPTRTNAMCFIYNPLIRPNKSQKNP